MLSLTKLQWRLKSEPIKDGPTLNVTVNLNMTSKIESVACPNIKLAVDLPDRPTETSVAFKLENTDADQDLIFSASLVEPHKYATFLLQDTTRLNSHSRRTCARVQKDKDGKMAAMVTLYPEIEGGKDDKIYTECIFLIDRSGSMSGSRIAQARSLFSPPPLHHHSLSLFLFR